VRIVETGPFVLLLATACSASMDQSALRRAEIEKRDAQAAAFEARQEAMRARADAKIAHEEAAEAARAQHRAEEDAQGAGERAAMVAELACPRVGSAELQADRPPAAGHRASAVVLFAAGGAALSTEAKRTLDDLVGTLRTHPVAILIDGYADDYVGAESRNVQLSRERAEAVASYLDKQGVSRDRVLTKGLGSRGQPSRRDAGINRHVLIVAAAGGK
jgi:outer membrane protein OmpA-like peptidoglycan-associated protein